MDTVRRSMLLLAAIAILAGCQRKLIRTPNLYVDTEINPFADVPPELATSTVDLLYVTDRKPEDTTEGDVKYGYGRSLSMAFGSCTVEIGRNMSWAELVAASRTKKRAHPIPLNVRSVTEQYRFPKTPGTIVIVDGEAVEAPEYVTARQRAIDALHDELRRRLAKTPRKEAYVYVHGYANTFEKGAYRMAEMWHFLGREGVPILYTWPAGHPGMLRGYTRDRESGEFTIFHLKELIKAVASCPEIETIHIIAHSRGTDIMMTALREVIVRTRIAGHPPDGDFGANRRVPTEGARAQLNLLGRSTPMVEGVGHPIPAEIVRCRRLRLVLFPTRFVTPGQCFSDRNFAHRIFRKAYANRVTDPVFE